MMTQSPDLQKRIDTIQGWIDRINGVNVAPEPTLDERITAARERADAAINAGKNPDVENRIVGILQRQKDKLKAPGIYMNGEKQDWKRPESKAPGIYVNGVRQDWKRPEPKAPGIYVNGQPYEKPDEEER
jgi:hypothetical protein